MRCVVCSGTGVVSDVLVVGETGLTLDPRRCSLTWGGTEFRIQRWLFDLLYFLAGRQGVVISPAEIYEALWGGAMRQTDGGAVKVTVAQLRKDLAKQGVPNIIQTIHGYGYGIL